MSIKTNRHPGTSAVSIVSSCYPHQHLTVSSTQWPRRKGTILVWVCIAAVSPFCERHQCGPGLKEDHPRAGFSRSLSSQHSWFFFCLSPSLFTHLTVCITASLRQQHLLSFMSIDVEQAMDIDQPSPTLCGQSVLSWRKKSRQTEKKSWLITAKASKCTYPNHKICLGRQLKISFFFTLIKPAFCFFEIFDQLPVNGIFCQNINWKPKNKTNRHIGTSAVSIVSHLTMVYE